MQFTQTNHIAEMPYNRIVFGAPGTGKSYLLNKDSSLFCNRKERVTFYPSYAYAQFIGTYKPVMKYYDGEEVITYEYVPGPFMRVYVNAIRDQLIAKCLDEYKEMGEGVSYYYISAADMSAWNLFEEISGQGATEYFGATKEMKKGDVAYIYIGNNTLGYEPGIYAIARMISNPEIAGEELVINLRFDQISYTKPLIPKEILDKYNTQYRSAHKIKEGKELLNEMKIESKTDMEWLLLIEEINRANTAAVFGDIFQLLDRKDGRSEYPIETSKDQRQYLENELWMYDYDYTKLSIPDNMYIWATMNSADQGVFPMDTAFKRRWEFQYIGIDDGWDDADYYVPLKNKEGYYLVAWNSLRSSINNALLTQRSVSEDKLIGPFFLSGEVLKNASKPENYENFIGLFKSKIIMYLFEDVVKMNPSRIFNDTSVGRMIYSDICKTFENIGEEIFVFGKLEHFSEVSDSGKVEKQHE